MSVSGNIPVHRLLPIGDLPSGRESKPYRSAEAVPAGSNEGEA